MTLAWSPLARAGDLNTEMQQMFNDIGAMSSVTGPSAYKGQAMSLYMGGDMQLRTPIRNYQLYNFPLPSVKSSCGGVDAFLGSFSHIDSAAFKSNAATDRQQHRRSAIPGCARVDSTADC